jgi:hypothetical protein
MTREDCKRILDNLEVIRHFAEGGDIQSCLHNYTGAFVQWNPPSRTILLSCLGRYRIVKPHIKTSEGKNVVLTHNPSPCRVDH